jgi:hypothetical protein
MILAFGSGVTLLGLMDQMKGSPCFVWRFDLAEAGCGRYMKFVAAIFLFISFLAFPKAQVNASTKSASAPIGLPVGQKAPTFAAHDQFGHEQSNDTLKGSNGTVLLFFRSADW